MFSAGYEAFMPPADFGFDLIITNLKERSKGPRLEGRILEPPFALQIKSRRIMPSDFRTSTTGRDEAEVSVLIKKAELDLLVSTTYSFLVVVLLIQGETKKFEDRTIHSWFSSVHINALVEREYFHPDENDRRVRKLICGVRMLPMLVVEPLLDTLVSQNHLTEEGRRILMYEMPARVPRTWRASEYVTLARKARDKTDYLVWRQVPKELSKLNNIGFEVALGHID